MRTATSYPHIEQDENGKLYVVGSGFKVILLIADHVAWKYSAEQLVLQHPGLGMGAAHSVLGYFYDNEAEVRGELARRERGADELLARIGSKNNKRDLLARLQAEVAAEARACWSASTPIITCMGTSFEA